MTVEDGFRYRLNIKRLAKGEEQPDGTVEWTGEGAPNPELTDVFLALQQDFWDKVKVTYPPPTLVPDKS